MSSFFDLYNNYEMNISVRNQNKTKKQKRKHHEAIEVSLNLPFLVSLEAKREALLCCNS